MAKTAKAFIYRSDKRGKDSARISGFRYKLKGVNGENLGSSQHYTRKEKAIQTLTRYHPNFTIVDLTIK